MFFTRGDYKTPNETLFNDIQKVYAEYFHPETPYSCHLEYKNIVNYGFTDFQTREYKGKRVMTADEYVQFCGTHCDHLTLKEPDRSSFFNGVRDAVNAHGGSITMMETYVLYTARKI